MLTSIHTLHLEYFDEKTIAVITLDDPARANAMSPEMGDAFSEAIREIQGNAAARAAIIRGAGKHFSVGGHRDMLIKLGSSNMDEAQLREFMLGLYNRWLPMLELDGNAAQQAKDLQTDDYRRRVAHYLPNHYE
jgi:enoyl-CoA hydratase/carnithine racemase